MKDNPPKFDNDDAPKTPATPDAERVRAQQIAAIHADRLKQAAVDTRFDASKYQRKEQR